MGKCVVRVTFEFTNYELRSGRQTITLEKEVGGVYSARA